MLVRRPCASSRGPFWKSKRFQASFQSLFKCRQSSTGFALFDSTDRLSESSIFNAHSIIAYISTSIAPGQVPFSEAYRLQSLSL